MGEDYPELKQNQDLIYSTVEPEEVQFRKTLATGSNILDSHLDKLTKGEKLPGSVAFLLHDTYGFPYEVTEEVVSEQGIELDRPGFDEAMETQRTQSKEANKSQAQSVDHDQVQTLLDNHGITEFVGRDRLVDVSAKVLLVTETDDKSVISLFVDRTPMYAEAGGQIGDTGTVLSESVSGEVIDTVYAIPGVHRHLVKVTSETSFSVGDEVKLSVNVAKRDAIRRNHTGTHIIHWALRQVLGDHVKQQGSLVSPDRLRFDFSHFEAVTPDQIAQIEDLANEQILANPNVSHEEMTKAQAEAKGAVAFFGDKYGDTVRVLEAGPSLEFCGGTHVKALGDIGTVKIVSEGSIGSNLRRIEAVTGLETILLLRSEQDTLAEAAGLLNVAKANLLDGIGKKSSEIEELKDELSSLKSHLVKYQATELIDSASGGVIISRVDGLERKDLQQLAISLRDSDGVNTVVLGGAPGDGGAALVAAVDSDSKVTASDLIADGAKAIKGGGGKGDDFAMAGGKDPNGIDAALDLARQVAGVV